MTATNQDTPTDLRLPVHLLYSLLQSGARVEVWLYENRKSKLQGRLLGFDAYMNLVLDDAAEVHTGLPARPPTPLGRLLLKGENVVLVRAF
ncbi:hypothetical protein CDCA_CDCA07G2209 [Cyanidium caldarium]|uniref:Small nuclear ribonucleoprotein E n=1 Tax=Cyanidium caldarium TaxID=2771 RepID=A0AAV9IV83_CYACA|nr:hypothetical protein CDCA_CDCA07G2209 [Cyanidium caldarium]